jgi:DNA adenine methylase
MKTLIPYIGGKHRIAVKLAEFLRSTGADTVVDVFGGSAAVLLNSGFRKRVYNDADGDLVNLMRVIASDAMRPKLLRMIRLFPAARRIFEDHYREYIGNSFSFAHVADPVERAFRTFYRHQFAFGGKSRTGGFTLSCGDRPEIKEVQRYRNGIRRIAELGVFFRETAIECMDYQDCIATYGRRHNIVLFVDPPYYGKENYYSHAFRRADHVWLAQQLATVAAAVCCTYYDDPMIRELYPVGDWTWTPIPNVKNSQGHGSQKHAATDWVLMRSNVPVMRGSEPSRPTDCSAGGGS